MKNKTQKHPFLLGLVLIAFSATGCLTSQKIDKYVAQQYGNQLPKLSKKQPTTAVVQMAKPSENSEISSTIHKTDKFLPLLVYWNIKTSQNCSLNTAIAQASISNTLNSSAAKSLAQKLNGQQLELTLEEAPSGFSLIDDTHVIWVIYAISWSKVYVQPDAKDLVLSYKLPQGDGTFKTGKITVRNAQLRQNLRFFQSWKSAISEYIESYNANLTAMSRMLVSRLSDEL